MSVEQIERGHQFVVVAHFAIRQQQATQNRLRNERLNTNRRKNGSDNSNNTDKNTEEK